MTVLTDVDVLRDVAAGRVPPQVARRDKLVDGQRGDAAGAR